MPDGANIQIRTGISWLEARHNSRYNILAYVWHDQRDLNSHLTDLESVALPIKLWSYWRSMTDLNRRSSHGQCDALSQTMLMLQKLVGDVGFEPTTPSLKARYSSR